MRYNAEKTIMYGNPFYENLEFSRGSCVGGMSAEALNALNIQHNVNTPVKVLGKVDRKYVKYCRDGHAEAFLVRGARRKRVVNHTTVDSNGCIEFRLNSLLGRCYLFITSSHINWNFICMMKNFKAGWTPVCVPDGGWIYWGIVKANHRSVKSGKIILKNIKIDNKSSSIREIEKCTLVRLRKNAVSKTV